MRVVVLDYGSGNVRSAVRALERAGPEKRTSALQRTCRDQRACSFGTFGMLLAQFGQLRNCFVGLAGFEFGQRELRFQQIAGKAGL